jgi:hypothetical protein
MPSCKLYTASPIHCISAAVPSCIEINPCWMQLGCMTHHWTTLIQTYVAKLEVQVTPLPGPIKSSPTNEVMTYDPPSTKQRVSGCLANMSTAPMKPQTWRSPLMSPKGCTFYNSPPLPLPPSGSCTAKFKRSKHGLPSKSFERFPLELANDSDPIRLTLLTKR